MSLKPSGGHAEGLSERVHLPQPRHQPVRNGAR